MTRVVGTVRLRDGSIAAGRALLARPLAQSMAVQSASVVVPTATTIVTDNGGQMDQVLTPGNYILLDPKTGAESGMAVPDVAQVDVVDCLDATAIADDIDLAQQLVEAAQAIGAYGGGEFWVDAYGANAIPGVTDMTTAIQAAIDAASAAGGGLVRLASGTYAAAGLTLPSEVSLCGAGEDATILKLKDGANTWLIASSQWVNNQASVNLRGGIQDMTLDGNLANNPSAPALAIISSYRFHVSRATFKKCAGDGLRLSLVMRDGVTLTTNGMAETTIFNSCFQENGGHGIACRDLPRGDGSYKMADIFILTSKFYNNGGAGIYADRSAGFFIYGNQIYGQGTHGMYLDKFARATVAMNNIEITGAAIAAGQVVAGVYIAGFSSQGAFTIAFNLVIINPAADTVGKTVAALAIAGTTNDRGTIFPGSWVDLTTAKGGVQEWRSPAAQASLANVSYPLMTGGGLTLSETDFVLTDDLDPTKRIRLHPANAHPTGTTLDFYFRAGGGTFALLEQTAKFAGVLGYGGYLVHTIYAPGSFAASTTLTAGNLKGPLIKYTGTGGHVLTLPTGALMDSNFGNVGTDEGVIFFVQNTGSGACSIAAGAGFTVEGNASIAAGASAQVLARKSGAATWVAYRL